MIFRKKHDTGFVSLNASDVCRDGFRTSAVLEVMPWRRAGEPLHCGRAELSYDDTALYVRMRAYETELIATRRAFGEPVCRDSCLEFFFAPEPHKNAYFNFEVNPLATMYVGFRPAHCRRLGSELCDPVRFYSPLRAGIQNAAARQDIALQFLHLLRRCGRTLLFSLAFY